MKDTFKYQKKKLIVGFCGLKRSGKGIAAQGIEDMGYVDLPFAGGLKAMLTAWLEYNGVTDTELYTDDWYKDHKSRYFCNKEFRHAMQSLGTEWGRKMIGESMWIDGWHRKIKEYDRIAVSDVRFPDEVDAIKNLGGIIIKIHRPSFHNKDTHVSETNMEKLKADFEIVNVTIEETQKQVREIVEKYTKENKPKTVYDVKKAVMND